jgi:hypothetical protein
MQMAKAEKKVTTSHYCKSCMCGTALKKITVKVRTNSQWRYKRKGQDGEVAERYFVYVVQS